MLQWTNMNGLHAAIQGMNRATLQNQDVLKNDDQPEQHIQMDDINIESSSATPLAPLKIAASNISNFKDHNQRMKTTNIITEYLKGLSLQKTTKALEEKKSPRKPKLV